MFGSPEPLGSQGHLIVYPGSAVRRPSNIFFATLISLLLLKQICTCILFKTRVGVFTGANIQGKITRQIKSILYFSMLSNNFVLKKTVMIP